MGNLAAEYGDYTLRMTLPHRIGMDRLVATPQNFMAQLRRRTDMPKQLRGLIAELFRRGAITRCSISYGQRWDVQISRTGPNGRMLLRGRALEQFGATFAAITGQSIQTTHQPTSGIGWRAGGGDRDYSGVALFLAHTFDAVCDGLVVAAALDQLFGDD